MVQARVKKVLDKVSATLTTDILNQELVLDEVNRLSQNQEVQIEGVSEEKMEDI